LQLLRICKAVREGMPFMWPYNRVHDLKDCYGDPFLQDYNK
jgi:hypothetical protein